MKGLEKQKGEGERVAEGAKDRNSRHPRAGGHEFESAEILLEMLF